MKKKIIYAVLLFILILLLIFKYINDNLLFLPKGEYLYTVSSPNKINKVNVYLVDGGSISADAIRIELDSNKKNIYWNYPCNEVTVVWIDDSNILINDVRLNVYNDKYKNN